MGQSDVEMEVCSITEYSSIPTSDWPGNDQQFLSVANLIKNHFGPDCHQASTISTKSLCKLWGGMEKGP